MAVDGLFPFGILVAASFNDGSITKAKVQALLTKGKITQDEYNTIIGPYS